MSDADDDPFRVPAMLDGVAAVYNLETLAGVGLSSALVSTDEAGAVRGSLGELWRSPAAFGWVAVVLEESGDSEAQHAVDDRGQGAGLRRAAELLTRTMDVMQRALDAAGLLEDVRYQLRGGLGTMAETLADGAKPAANTAVVRRRRIRRELVLDAAGELRVNAEGVLVLDELLAAVLDGLDCRETAAKVRATPAEERGVRWVGPVPKACRAVLAGVWAKRKDEIQATPMRLPAVEVQDASYVQVPKITSGLAWAIGTVGEKVDGDEYAEAPAVTRYVSRSLGLTAGRLKQGLLPVGIEEAADAAAVEGIVVRVVRDTQALISGLGGKAALLFAVASPSNGELCRASVDELARMLKPNARLQGRDRRDVLDVVRELRAVLVELPNRVDLPLWQIAAPRPDKDGKVEPGAEVFFGWSRLATTQELGAVADRRWRGRFLLNLSGAMRIDSRYPLELRAYVQAAAAWNQARIGEHGTFKPEATLKGSPEELAIRFNALSPAAIQALAERGGVKRIVLSQDKKRVVEALEYLADDAKLIELAKKGDEYQLLPPAALLEAHELMRERGARPVEPEARLPLKPGRKPKPK